MTSTSTSSDIVLIPGGNYRKIAQRNWGLTDEQMKGMHVHHRTPRSKGGTNDPSNLYVCSPWFHSHIWHGDGAVLSLRQKLIEFADNRRGAKDSPETIEKKRQVKFGKKRGPPSQETREKIRKTREKRKCGVGNQSAKGNSFTLTAEQKENRRRAALNRPELTCPVCGKKCKGKAGLSRHITTH